MYKHRGKTDEPQLFGHIYFEFPNIKTTIYLFSLTGLHLHLLLRTLDWTRLAGSRQPPARLEAPTGFALSSKTLHCCLTREQGKPNMYIILQIIDNHKYFTLLYHHLALSFFLIIWNVSLKKEQKNKNIYIYFLESHFSSFSLAFWLGPIYIYIYIFIAFWKISARGNTFHLLQWLF